MGAQLGSNSDFSDINMTPLIDIVLVVLIIMMVNIPIEIERMGVKLPSEVVETPPPPDEMPEQLVVSLYHDGRMALNRRLMDEDTLFGEVTRRLRGMDDKVVFIDAHPDMLYNDVVNMVDLAKAAGAEKVSFGKLKPEGPLEPTSASQGALPRGIYPGSPAVIGAIDQKHADAQFQPMMPVIKACYDDALAAHAGLAGRLVIRVDVGPAGQILGSGIVESTLDDSDLYQCILDKVPGLHYEPLGDQLTARIHYPFLLSAG